MQIDDVPVNALRAYKNNARVHTALQIDLIAKSIKQCGFVNPIIADANLVVVAGHGRLEAAKSLGMKTCPVIQVSNLSDEQVAAYRILDNRLAELSEFDQDVLRLEMEILQGLDLEDIGFDDEFINELTEEKEEKDADLIDITSRTAEFFISITGDLSQQCYVLERLKDLLSDVPDVEITIGKINE